MSNFLTYLDSLWKHNSPQIITKTECWKEYLKKHDLPLNSTVNIIEKLTFDDFDELQREFTSKSILKCIACGSDNVDWQSVQTCRADESETIFAECKTCKKKWRFR